uniref:Neur_chan_LBD domain-containing protein n=1 Tax=Globodera pallida TaxID=36090 RepID=A0A183BJS8_GLOPA
MNLFSILTLPMGPKELDQDMAKINSQMHDLLPKLFVGYDRTVPPSTKNGGPVEIQSLLVVDHIEELLKSSGLIIAELTVSIKAACRIDLKNYPYDNQTCFVFLFTPAYPSARVTFSTSSAMFSKESLQGSIGFSEQNLFEIFGGFNLIGMNVQRFFAYGQFFTVNESVAAIFSNIANTVLLLKTRMEQQKFCDGNPSGESNGILPQFVKRIRPSSVSGLCQLQFVVRCILAIETVLIFWRLFC